MLIYRLKIYLGLIPNGWVRLHQGWKFAKIEVLRDESLKIFALYIS